jgi:phosphatidylglycerol:prolipoprotein diacylglycerol transferase
MFEVEIPLYSMMILLSLVANIIVVAFISKKYNFASREIICLLLYENAGIIGGAKILTYLQHYDELNGQFDFLRLGLTSYGAVIGAFAFLLLFSLQFNISRKEILFTFMPSMPLMYGIGKVGCYLAGCCYGVEYGGFGSVIYRYSASAPDHTQLFPVQLVEAIYFIGIFLALLIAHNKNRFNMNTVGISLVVCGLGKFLFEFLRASHTGEILSLNQIISIVCIGIGCGTIAINGQQSHSERFGRVEHRRKTG